MADQGGERTPRPQTVPEAESSVELLRQARAGGAEARERLVARYRQALARWAHGRLPRYAREYRDTDDIVQEALIRAMDALESGDRFQPRHEEAFLAYLRQIVRNHILDEIRRANRQPRREEFHERLAGAGASPLQEAIDQQFLKRYEECLSQLSEDQRRSVVLRLELGLSYGEIARKLKRPSANAARQVIVRAVLHLRKALDAYQE